MGKIRPADVKPSTYVDFNEENNKKYRKFEVRHHLQKENYFFQIGQEKFS